MWFFGQKPPNRHHDLPDLLVIQCRSVAPAVKEAPSGKVGEHRHSGSSAERSEPDRDILKGLGCGAPETESHDWAENRIAMRADY